MTVYWLDGLHLAWSDCSTIAREFDHCAVYDLDLCSLGTLLDLDQLGNITRDIVSHQNQMANYKLRAFN